jgi:hypothetical protein
MDPLINSKMILLSEINLIQELGFNVPYGKKLTTDNYLDEIIFYNQILKKQYLQKYGNLDYEVSKKQKLEKSVDKFLTCLLELNNAINENYSFDAYNMMLNYMEKNSVKYKYNLSRDQLDSMLKTFIKNKLMN